uniref:class I SAM-dependent methyltransferase n=1 Tax=uncultured Altererythrobacter sp. TaxID=500840 RepID=UPI0026278343|nr:class I SAM-dependent methyltransferase [uncultured Altererythrobacter sp.]
MSQQYRDPMDFYRSHWAEFARRRAVNSAEGDWIDAFIDLLPAGARVLDVGCGSGLPIARKLVSAGLVVTGIDTTPEFCELARRNVPSGTFLEMDMREFEFPQRFDGIVA